MKRFTTILAALALAATAVQSQTPVQKPRNAVEVLKKMRDDNAKLLQRQADSLKKLEELETTAKTVKMYASRG